MRVVRSLLAFCFFLAAAVTVALVFALYLAATGRNLPMLRAVVSAAGRTIAGQRTEAVALRLRLRPAEHNLAGTARLTVRAIGAERRRLYFLLNPGLAVRAVWQEDVGTARTPLRAYRLGPLEVVELSSPLAADAQLRLAVEYGGQPRGGGGALSSGAVLETDDVVLGPADFWYPSDVQGFFQADVDVDLPAELTLLHNGHEESRTRAGTSTRVRWTSQRPVAGLALVAGRYRVETRDAEGMHYQVALAEGVDLDPARLLVALADAEQGLRAHYGASGFTGTSLYVNRRLPRAFNDGAGLLGIPPRYFHDGDYGYKIVAHETAHDWWGATVAEQWLTPGSGGEWIVEGFAEYSSWRAVREQLGEAALLRTLAANFFDPDDVGALQAMSVLDNGLDPNARPTIYNKGGYVAFMLAQQLGGDGFDAAAQRFLEEFRYKQASADDLEAIFASAAQQDLKPFFNAWVRGTDSADLVLEPQEGDAQARNVRTAPVPAEIGLWRIPPDGDTERQRVALGATTPLGAGRDILDPQALVADMFRGNNVLPRRDPARAVAASARGELMVVRGEPYAWEPATVDIVSAGGAIVRSWVIDHGLLTEPAWSADGTRILAVESARRGQPTLLALNASDGGRQSLGHDTQASGAADGTIVARGDRLLRLAGGKATPLAEHPGARLTAPLVAPDGAAIAYAVLRGADMELRVLPAAGDGQVLFTWPSGPLRWRWSPDGTRLFAALPGDWDWQLWELPLDGGAPRALVREAADIADLAVAPDGNRVALAAQAEVGDPLARHAVFLIDRTGRVARHFGIDGWSASSLAWLDDDSLAVVAAQPANASLPVAAELRRLRLSEGTLEPFGS